MQSAGIQRGWLLELHGSNLAAKLKAEAAQIQMEARSIEVKSVRRATIE